LILEKFVVNKRFRPPIRLLVIAAVLIILGFVILPITSEPPEKVTAMTVLITGIPFLLVFVGILLTYIALIITLSRYFSGYISQKSLNPIFYACIIGIVAGIILMFQPIAKVLYTIGFIILLISLLSFIAVSHITARRELIETQE
jgi:hypothetical protein